MSAAWRDMDRKALLEEALRLRAEVHQAGVHKQLLRQLMLAVEETRRQVAALDRQKDEFLGMAAHDIRSPLTVIRGFAATMASYPEVQQSADLSDFVKLIEDSAERILNLVNDLLDISKIESGKLELHRAPTDLRDLVADGARFNRPLAERKQIGLATDVPDEPVVAEVDRERMDQVLGNLLSNAIKFSQADTTITVSVCRTGPEVALAVADQGQGIPPEDLPHLFEKFRQTKTKATAGEKGTGLGLAIVKKIVELHGGRIEVESELGRGTRFTVWLPGVTTN
jgi:signal transduction histidine kinase